MKQPINDYEKPILMIFPNQDSSWICQVQGEKVLPLGLAPSLGRGVFFFAKDPDYFACIDQEGKRIGLYRFTQTAPWYEKVISPSTLPRSCLAYDVLIHEEKIFVGGISKSGECLWVRGVSHLKWEVVPLPENFPRKRYKAIDLLFLDGQRLIAVDNVVYPKWILSYDVSPSKSITHLQTYDLHQHTSYEHVIKGAKNDAFIVLFSKGLNHGSLYSFLSVLDVKTLKELYYWCLENEKSETHSSCLDGSVTVDEIDTLLSYLQDLDEEALDGAENDELVIPGRVKNLAFLGDFLLVLTEKSLMYVKLTKLSANTISQKLIHQYWQFSNLSLKRVIKPINLVKHPATERVFVAGYDENNEMVYEAVCLAGYENQ